MVPRKSDEIKQMTTLTMITISGIYVRYLKFHLALLSSEFGSEIMLTPGQAGPIGETETKG